MPTLIGGQRTVPYYKRMIQCPGHWLVSPKVDVYLREPVGLLKDCSDTVYIKDEAIKIKKWRIKKDRWGRKLVDWKKLHELRKTGLVQHPMVSAAWAIEHVYDPISWVCEHCDKRCKEGQGRVIETTIKRLSR